MSTIERRHITRCKEVARDLYCCLIELESYPTVDRYYQLEMSAKAQLKLLRTKFFEAGFGADS